MEATTENLAFIRTMRKHGVLLDVDPTKRDLSRGMIAVPCADCDQRMDLMGHAESMFRGLGLEPRIHPLSLNGGALGIPNASPLNRGDRRGSVLLEDIVGANTLKRIDLVVLWAHTPCGAAGLHDLTTPDVLRLLMEAEARVKLVTTTRDMRVDAFFHVDWKEQRPGGKPKKCTYFVSHRAWKAWTTINGTTSRLPVVNAVAAAQLG